MTGMNPDAVLDEDQKKIRFRKLLLKRQRLRANGRHDEANFQDEDEVSDDNDDNEVEDRMDHDDGNLVQDEDDQQNIEANHVEHQLQKQDLPPLLAVNCQTSVASFPQFVPMSSRCQKQNQNLSQDHILHQALSLNQKQSHAQSQNTNQADKQANNLSLHQKYSQTHHHYQSHSQDQKQSHAQSQNTNQADKLTYNLSLHQRQSQTHNHYQSHILDQKQYHSPYHYQSQTQINRLHQIQTQKQNYIHHQNEKLVPPQLIEKEDDLNSDNFVQNDYKKQGQSQTQNRDQKQNQSLHQNHDQNYDNLSLHHRHQSHCQKIEDQSPPQLIENINSEFVLQNQKQNQYDMLEEGDNFLLKIKSIVRSYQMAVAQTKCPKSDELFVKLNAIQRGVAGMTVSKKEVLFLITKMSDVFRHFALLQR
jgi:hypothetical protein